MKRIHRALLLLTLLPPSLHAQQTSVLSGVVRDDSTDQPLVAANIRIIGSGRGTITNSRGEYRLPLTAGEYRFVFSFIGYKTDTLTVRIDGNVAQDVRLVPTAITFSEVVVTGEDPAIRIMRRVIENKKRWKEALKSYSFSAFTRQVVLRDTAIASITESHTDGYWVPGDSLHEVIKQKRQTENVPLAENFAAVGRILNFYDDDVRFAGYSFVGPASLDAFDHYSYKLLATRSRDSSTMFEVQLIPKSNLTPLFTGTLMVVDGSFALAGVRVSPNEAFLLPFVTDLSIHYAQQFNLYEGKFWMPADIRIDGSADIGIPGFTIPRIGFQQTSAIVDYRINWEIPDTIFAKPRRWPAPGAETVDSLFWAEHDVLPLTPLERRAYFTLDSTQTLEKQFQPGGPLSFLTSKGTSPLSHLQALFNRVEGFHLGFRITADSLLPHTRLYGSLGYGFSDKRGKFQAALELSPGRDRLFSIGYEQFREVAHRPDANYFDELSISLQALTAKDDYRDYYMSDGWTAYMSAQPQEKILARIAYSHQTHRSLPNETGFSIFSRGDRYRSNPPILEGELHSLGLFIRYGDKSVPLQLTSRRAVELELERSDRSRFGSDFDFTRLSGRFEWTVPTFFRRFLFPATLRVILAGGISGGALPPQRTFDIETRSSGVAPFGVLRGASVKEFSGDRYVALSIEHNFRSGPFLALGLPFLYKKSIELVIHGSAAQTWVENRQTLQRAALTPTRGWYTEAGVGLNRILSLFRIDLTWRFKERRDLFFTVAAAVFF
ncbi:MAG TPA: DUF5686 family protein [Bacteroidota bacterium]